MTIIENSGTGQLGEGILPITEVLRIGKAQGSEMEELFRVTDVAVAEDGTIFIANSGTGTIRVFDASGAFVREFGGTGGGPSEVDYLVGVFLAGDRVVVRGNRSKTVLFTREGEFLASWTTPSARVGAGASVIGRSTTGWIVQVAKAIPAGGNVRFYPVDEPWVWLYDTEDPASDISAAPFLEYQPAKLYEAEEGTVYWQLFSAFSVYGTDANGLLYLTRPPDYRVDILDPDGRLTRSVRRTVESVPVGASDIDEVRALLNAYYDSTGASPGLRARWLRDLGRQATLPLPDRLPALSRIVVGYDGGFWVQRGDQLSPARYELSLTWRRQFETTTIWDIFDVDGVLQGATELPARFTPRFVRGLDVTGVLLDDVDVEHVVTYRVTANR